MDKAIFGFVKVCAVSVVLLFLACPLVPQTGSLRGRVLAEGTLQPIINAQVTLVDTVFSDSTDSSGEYLIENIPIGSYSVSVTAPGFVMQIYGPVQIQPNITWGLDFLLVSGL